MTIRKTVRDTGIYERTTLRAVASDQAGMREIFGKVKQAWDQGPDIGEYLERAEKLARWYLANKPTAPIRRTAETVLRKADALRAALSKGDADHVAGLAFELGSMFERLIVRRYEPDVLRIKKISKSGQRGRKSQRVSADKQHADFTRRVEGILKDSSLMDIMNKTRARVKVARKMGIPMATVYSRIAREKKSRTT
jgi:hypothetical protein